MVKPSFDWSELEKAREKGKNFNRLLRMNILKLYILLVSNGVSAGIFGYFYCSSKKLIGYKDAYIIQNLVVEGGYGKIFTATQMSTKNTVIIKQQIHAKDKEIFRNEMEFNRMAKGWDFRVDSPLVLSIDDNSETSEVKNQPFWMAFHYYPLGTLENRFFFRRIFPFLKSIGHDVLQGLRMLHKNGYVHNDLKLENIIVTEKNSSSIHVKLIDFGLVTSENSQLVGGSTTSISPEVLLSFGDYPYSRHINSDMWSFGVVMHSIRTGRNLFFDGSEDIESARRILLLASYTELHKKFSDLYKNINEEEKHLYQIAKSVGCDVKSSLEYEKSCSTYLLDHDCYCDLVLKCFRFNPVKRISSFEALKHPFFQTGDQ